MKKLLLALVVFSLAMVLLPSPVMAGTWTMATAIPDNATAFWVTLHGEVSSISAVSTVYSGFVWDTVMHDDPGTTAPGGSDYADSVIYDDVHSSPYIFEYGPNQGSGAFLLPFTTYYFRACVYFGAPNNTWDYGLEMFYTTNINAEGSWGIWGYAPPEGPCYLQVSTDNAVTVDKVTGDATFNASIGYVGGGSGSIEDYGFVVDNVSHFNPSGWFVSYTDVAPGASDYTDYYEADDMGYTEDNFSFSFAATGLDPTQTYYIRAVADIPTGGDWVYGPEIEFVLTDCSVPTLQPPEDLVATPVTGTEIELTWTNPNPQWYTNDCENHTAFYPNLTAVIRMEAWEYPDDPPSLTDNSTLIYQAGAWATGAHSYTVNGLTPGTSYYFRIWFYDTVYGYTDYDEDFATPYAGTEPPEDVDVPDNWFTDPTCDSWENVPGAMVVINGIETDYGLPHNTLCLFINLFLLSCAMTTSFGGVAIVTRRPTGTQTIMVPFIVMCAGFIIGPVIGAFPGFFLAIGVIIGIGVAFAWSRA